jgi:hypothetical protein
MKSIRISLAASALLLVGCSTLFESVNPNDTTTGYQATTNKNGETVYRRERYVGPPYSTPAPTPFPTPEPTPWPVASSLDARSSEAPLPNPSETSLDGEKTKPGLGLGVELSSDSQRFHLGAMIIGEIGFVDAKLGLSLFSGARDLYAGFDLGVRPKYEFGHYAVFAGLGVYAGDTKNCTTDNYVETCEKKFLYAGYAEVGVYLWNISLFARSYNIEEAGKRIPSDTFLGIGFQTDY